MIDDLPKLVLACALVVVAALALWPALDRRSPAARALGRAWRQPAFRRAVTAVILILALVAVAEDVLEQEQDEWVRRLDAVVLAALSAPGDGVRHAAALVSRLTGEGLAVAVGGIVALLALRRRRRDAVVLGAAVVGAWAASGLLKILLLVPRPRAHDVLRLTASYGFPSGHAMVTLVALGTVVWLLARPGGTRVLLMIGASIVAVAAGLSRVVLAAHWPSDIVAGLALGAMWLVLLPSIVPDPPAARTRPGAGPSAGPAAYHDVQPAPGRSR